MLAPALIALETSPLSLGLVCGCRVLRGCVTQDSAGSVIPALTVACKGAHWHSPVVLPAFENLCPTSAVVTTRSNLPELIS